MKISELLSEFKEIILDELLKGMLLVEHFPSN